MMDIGTGTSDASKGVVCILVPDTTLLLITRELVKHWTYIICSYWGFFQTRTYLQVSPLPFLSLEVMACTRCTPRRGVDLCSWAHKCTMQLDCHRSDAASSG